MPSSALVDFLAIVFTAEAAAEAASGFAALYAAIDFNGTATGAGADPGASTAEGDLPKATAGGTLLCRPVAHPFISWKASKSYAFRSLQQDQHFIVSWKIGGPV